MPIDDCQHSFSTLANKVLPRHMQWMRRQIKSPTPMADFATKGPATLRKQHGLDKDISGCYVLIENGKPIYTGISRKVITRLRQHVLGTTHFSASLLYRIAKQRHPHTMRRDRAMKHRRFLSVFEEARADLRKMDVAFIEIRCPVELCLFEVYCAMTLDTALYNSFRTH